MAAETVERVEILDNGVSVGWADVVDGRYSYALTHPSDGTHSISARCGGTTSSAWVVHKETLDIDDFADLNIQEWETLNRPCFRVSAELQDGHSGVHTYARKVDPEGGSISLQFKPHYTRKPYTVNAFIDFFRPYKSLRFLLLTVENEVNRYRGTLTTYDAAGAVIEERVLPIRSGGVTDQLQFDAADGKLISRLSFRAGVNLTPGGTEVYSVAFSRIYMMG